MYNIHRNHSNPLLISTDFLKYPFRHSFQAGIEIQLLTDFFFSSKLEVKKKIQLELKKKLSYKLTEYFFQFEINAKMDISKNQWRSTGG